MDLGPYLPEGERNSEIPSGDNGTSIHDPISSGTFQIALSKETLPAISDRSSSNEDDDENMVGNEITNDFVKSNIDNRNNEKKMHNYTHDVDTTSKKVIENSIARNPPTEDNDAIPPQTTNSQPNSSTQQNHLLSRYKASKDPVILDGWKRTVQVHLIIDTTTGSKQVKPTSKLLFDATQRSAYTRLNAVTFINPFIESHLLFPLDSDLPLLFLIDWESLGRDCNRLQLVLENLGSDDRFRIKKRGKKRSSAKKEAPYFLLVDMSGSTRQTGCPDLFRSLARDAGKSSDKSLAYAQTNDMNRIRLAKRNIVQNRYYDHSARKINIGELLPNKWDGTPPDYDKSVLQSPFSLRETFVSAIQQIAGGRPVTDKDSMRPVDVGFFWKSGDYSHYGFYRRDIGKVVKTLHHSPIEKKSGAVMENTIVMASDSTKTMETGEVQVKYIEQILTCKIIVITQRDGWEDHYRLMESLVSGAMVMTDTMVALPDGLVDKTNIVVYDSPKMLKDLIKYYLKPENKNERKRIAKKGYKLVMGRHRSWHRLEELLFGKPLTNANEPYAPAPPKEALLGFE
eukprot:CAMPEP_0197175124 /NCGR_PEP_ID=MMETSP1423-20130617/1426_1 /TAXON_ID=476441 /ORGANISM="Pseudo-nitzschia heimii, Strain UNC1101" /LENGTH=567 /DNA_ID=CAMNT_0042624199 /DNA_START=426 /DNA_END=2129 /DNA_ORIENTATION=+